MTYRFAEIRRGTTIQLVDADHKAIFKRIDGHLVKQYQAIVLHELDLRFCQSCLCELKSLDYNRQSERAEAYWISCVTRFFKCFGESKARAKLSASKIFKPDAGSTADFEYFRALRNKHIVHDENSFSDVLVAVAVNASEQEPPFVEVFASPIHLFTIEGDLERLGNLVKKALEWIAERRSQLEEALTATYIQWTRERLLALPDLTAAGPSQNDVFLTRK
ncbi:MAG TPA: hypothetical protein VM532_19120 [Burkholderiales bacterium]|jgi:hypothetical protein|nr:hypothetical protein [Burkholderiales bacterium]